MVVYCALLWYDILKKQAQSHNVPGELLTERRERRPFLHLLVPKSCLLVTNKRI